MNPLDWARVILMKNNVIRTVSMGGDDKQSQSKLGAMFYKIFGKYSFF